MLVDGLVKNALRPVALTIVLLVMGCASPVGEIKDEDYVWSEAILNTNYQPVYRNVIRGYQNCVNAVPSPSLDPDNKKGQVVFYAGGVAGWVYGKATVDAVDDNTTKFRIGVIREYDAPVFDSRGHFRMVVMQWARGSTSCE